MYMLTGGKSTLPSSEETCLQKSSANALLAGASCGGICGESVRGRYHVRRDVARGGGNRPGRRVGRGVRQDGSRCGCYRHTRRYARGGGCGVQKVVYPRSGSMILS